MTDPSLHPLEKAAFSRRTLLTSAVLIGVGGSAAFEAVAAGRVSAAAYVQYQLPFPTINGGRHATLAHTATDFGAASGTSIPAVADGIVTAVAGNNGGLGNRIELAHADGAFSGYCHMKYAPTLSVNASVARGATIGYVGGTNGSATPYDNHLHLAMSFTQGKTLAGQNGYPYCFNAWDYIVARTAATPADPPPGMDTEMTDMLYVATPSLGAEYNSGGLIVRHWSMWYQECPGAPLFPLSGGYTYEGSAMEVEYAAWAGARGALGAQRHQASATAIAGLIGLRGTTAQPIGNFA